MSLFAIEVLVGMGYFLGYLVTTALAFCHKEDACWGYAVVTLAAMIHLAVICTRCVKKTNEQKHNEPE